MLESLVWVVVILCIVIALGWRIWSTIYPSVPFDHAMMNSTKRTEETYVLKNDGDVTTEYTREELKEYDGEDGKPILIALMNRVFDITSHPTGRDFYGKDAGYGLFAGRDASCALATMDFDKINDTNVANLSAGEKETLNEWLSKFESKYKECGKLID